MRKIIIAIMITLFLALTVGIALAQDIPVTLDGNGNVTGIFATPQPQLSGYTTIPADDSRIAAFTAPKPAQLAAAALAAGINITSTGTTALNGTYPLDQQSQNNVSATVTFILVNSTFPGGGATMPWLDNSGGIHIFPSVTEFRAFATAYANYVAGIALYGMTGSGSLPMNAVSIP